MVGWRPGGEICLVCSGERRGSVSYPAAICRACERRLVNWAGRPVDLANMSLLGAGIQVSNGGDVIVNSDTPIFRRWNSLLGARGALRRRRGPTSGQLA